MSSLLNKFNFSILRRFFVILFLLTLFVFISAFSYARTISNDIADSVFRLHVIANSDNEEDQNLKYKVRDALLEHMNSISKNVSSKEEVIQIANDHKDDFQEIAENIISSYGYSYDVKINIGNFAFPTKKYGDISLPSGNYDALRVEIGTAKGQNWWCVMFPPLCFVDVSSGIVPEESKEIMKDNLTTEEYQLVSQENNSEVKFKFKLIEFFQNVKILTAKQ